MEKKPLVVIQCLVYNHEKYLRQALDSFLMQQTKFKFVVLVHDDVSKDKSADIINEYADKYPDIIIPLIETENQWSKGLIDKVMNTHLDKVGAKYIALCEGDDYWLDPLKLQKQVDILEKDDSLIACTTNIRIVDENSQMIAPVRENIVQGNITGRYNLRDFFQNNHNYHTGTVVYRNVFSSERDRMQEVLHNTYLQDWTLWIILHTMGDFYYLDDVTCAYRTNPTSINHIAIDKRRLDLAKENFRLIPLVASILPGEYSDIKDDLINNTAWMWYNLANAYRYVHQYGKMMYALLRCLFDNPRYFLSKIKQILHHTL